MPHFIGLCPYEPSKKTLTLLDDINLIFEREAEYLPLTLRQIFYRLVAVNKIDKTETAYKQLGERIARARRGGLIPFENIRDDGFVQPQFVGYDDLNHWTEATRNDAKNLELDKQRYQDIRLLVWCESGGMVQQLRQILSSRGIPVCSSGGFDSLTTKYAMAKHLSNLAKHQQVKVLHIGDYDASGVCMYEILHKDIFALAYEVFGETISFKRIALRPEHIKQYNLPTAPPKKKDKRIMFDDNKTTQCEAFAPSDFKHVVLKAVDCYIDDTTLQHSRYEELDARETTTDMLKNI